MYQILADEVAAFNGLGLTDAGVSLIKAGIDAATSITNNAVNARNARKTAEATGTATPIYTPTVYTGGNTNTYPPTTTTGATEKKTDWMPWLIGGAIAVAGIYLITRK
jgi:hypothetical protein